MAIPDQYGPLCIVMQTSRVIPDQDGNRRDRTDGFSIQKQPASGSRGMVVSNHPLASAASAEMLAAGGSCRRARQAGHSIRPRQTSAGIRAAYASIDGSVLSAPPLPAPKKIASCA